MNTDKAGEGLSVEYVETIGNSVLFKVINNSNVCYESVTYTVLFVPDAKEFYTENGTSAWHMVSGEVPAYSETYELFETPTYEKLAGEKEGSNSDKIYYDVVTIGEIVGIVFAGCTWNGRIFCEFIGASYQSGVQYRKYCGSIFDAGSSC